MDKEILENLDEIKKNNIQKWSVYYNLFQIINNIENKDTFIEKSKRIRKLRLLIYTYIERIKLNPSEMDYSGFINISNRLRNFINEIGDEDDKVWDCFTNLQAIIISIYVTGRQISDEINDILDIDLNNDEFINKIIDNDSDITRLKGYLSELGIEDIINKSGNLYDKEIWLTVAKKINLFSIQKEDMESNYNGNEVYNNLVDRYRKKGAKAFLQLLLKIPQESIVFPEDIKELYACSTDEQIWNNLRNKINSLGEFDYKIQFKNEYGKKSTIKVKVNFINVGSDLFPRFDRTLLLEYSTTDQNDEYMSKCSYIPTSIEKEVIGYIEGIGTLFKIPGFIEECIKELLESKEKLRRCPLYKLAKENYEKYIKYCELFVDEVSEDYSIDELKENRNGKMSYKRTKDGSNRRDLKNNAERDVFISSLNQKALPTQYEQLKYIYDKDGAEAFLERLSESDFRNIGFPKKKREEYLERLIRLEKSKNVLSTLNNDRDIWITCDTIVNLLKKDENRFDFIDKDGRHYSLQLIGEPVLPYSIFNSEQKMRYKMENGDDVLFDVYFPPISKKNPEELKKYVRMNYLHPRVLYMMGEIDFLFDTECVYNYIKNNMIDEIQRDSENDETYLNETHSIRFLIAKGIAINEKIINIKNDQIAEYLADNDYRET